MKNPSLARYFEVALYSTVEPLQQMGYNPTGFVQMLRKYGGVGAAKRLLQLPGWGKGLSRLWELGQLGRSVEAFVLLDRYSELFSLDELEEARERLLRFGSGDAEQFIAKARQHDGEAG